jgi:HEAT repeat protein
MRGSRLLLVLAACCFLFARSGPSEDAPPSGADKETLKAAKVGTDGPALLEFLRRRTLTPAERARINGLVRQLGDRSYKVRQKATASLVACGGAAVAALRGVANDADLEVSVRAEEALRRIKGTLTGPDVTAAAVRQLAQNKPEGAAAALLAFLPFAENYYVAGEVRQALTALAVRGGKPEKALVAALGDKEALKRAAAAEALSRAGAPGVRAALRKLLKDPEAAVRLRVAMGLAAAKDKDAVPVLIELLTQLPLAQAYLAQDFLYRIGEGQSPYVPLGKEKSAREQCRDAWAAWWDKHKDRTDLGKLSAKARPLGYTMLVLLDDGKVLERDAKGKQRWQIKGLDLPTDVQYLPGERLLITEHGGGRVSERTVGGKVLWEKKFNQPLMAQRLPTGNTFIATRTELLEIDRAGRKVFSYTPPNGDLLMRACKLPNGDVAFVSLEGGRGTSKYQRIDAGGKTLANFLVNVSTYGGRIQVLADGRALIPEMSYNRVVEYDARGRQVGFLRVTQPVVAVRLANGNTLVTTYQQHRAIEYDKDGKEVAEYKADTRVTRAWKR